MQNIYLTDTLTSVEDLNLAFEAIFTESKFDCQSRHSTFRSEAEGILTEKFFFGHQVLKDIDLIKVSNFDHFVITLPKVGQFSTNARNRTVLSSSRKTGAIVFPTDQVVYSRSTSDVDDYLIALNYDIIRDSIYRKYGIINAEEKIFQLQFNSDKVYALMSYLESTLDMVRGFPDIRESLFLKMNIRDITILMVTDLIGELLEKSSLLNNHVDKNLVIKAEEIMDNQGPQLHTVHEIADKLNTSARSLQLAFKKHREYTPMQFLRKSKLRMANKLIHQKGDSNITVKEAAISAGIFDLNRFGKYYAKEFGELPSETIKRAKP
jgi:AraC-like DNA-binding protein